MMESIEGGYGSEAEGERRRVPRLNLTQEQFRLDQNGKVYSVLDLSLGGMGLRVIDPADLIHFSVGAKVLGNLKIRVDKIRVQAVVRHLRKNRIGLEFESLSSDAKEHLQNHLNPVKIGASMKPIPAPDGRATWYHGSSGADLVIWRGIDGSRSRMGVFILGSFIQWDEIEGLSTGDTMAGEEQNEGRGIIGFETLYLEKDEKPDQGKLRLAQELLQNLDCPGDLKDWCLRRLSARG